MSLAAGTFFGPYRIARLIGAGGTGEVYAAVDTRLDRSVAISCPLAPRSSTAGAPPPFSELLARIRGD